MTETYLFRLSSLGDLILCSALAKALAKESDRHLNFVTSETFAPFVEQSFPVKLQVKGLKSRGLFHFFLDGFIEASRLKGRQNEIEIFDLHNVLKSRLWSWAFFLRARQLGLKVKIFRSPKKSLLRWMSVFLGRDLIGKRYIFQEHLKLLAPQRILETPELISPATRKTNFQKILLAPEAQHWKKIWPAGHWEKLIEKLIRESSWKLTLVGSSKALPLDLVDDLEALAGGRLENLLGKTQLSELPALAAAHDLCLCGNSAWLHISEAVGTPVVSLAGPIVPGFGFSPWRSQSKELSVSLPCRPCTRHGGGLCRLSGPAFHACMRNISPETVFTEISKIAQMRGLS